MTTFGTSAYLKLLALNPKPRDTEIRKRFVVSKRPYDFHKAMRKIVTEYASGGVDWTTTEARLNAIKKLPERNSATSAAHALAGWINGRQIKPFGNAGFRASSPNGIYSVKFSPDFEIEIGGRSTSIHIWNTLKPPIKIREAIGMLGLFVPDQVPESLGVLSLRTGELFLPTDAKSARDLARILALDIEKRLKRIAEEAEGRASKDKLGEGRASI